MHLIYHYIFLLDYDSETRDYDINLITLNKLSSCYEPFFTSNILLFFVKLSCCILWKKNEKQLSRRNPIFMRHYIYVVFWFDYIRIITIAVRLRIQYERKFASILKRKFMIRIIMMIKAYFKSIKITLSGCYHIFHRVPPLLSPRCITLKNMMI